jgi:hypothetical protein
VASCVRGRVLGRNAGWHEAFPYDGETNCGRD